MAHLTQPHGYQALVRDKLAGRAYVAFYATSKCVTDRSYAKELAHVLGEYRYHVIHFNNGLHSLGTDRAAWEASLRAAFALLVEQGQGASGVAGVAAEALLVEGPDARPGA